MMRLVARLIRLLPPKIGAPLRRRIMRRIIDGWIQRHWRRSRRDAVHYCEPDYCDERGLEVVCGSTLAPSDPRSPCGQAFVFPGDERRVTCPACRRFVEVARAASELH